MLTHDEQTLTIESRTVEEALASISERLGPDVEIVGAQKVVRGGMGGFFAREMVQISARRAGAGPPPEASGFERVLRSRLGPEPAGVEIDLPATGDDVRVVLRHEPGEEEAAVVAAMLAGPAPPRPEPDSALVAPAQPGPAVADAWVGPAGPDDAPAPLLAADAQAEAAEASAPMPVPAARSPRPRPALNRAGSGWSLDALLTMRLPAAIIRACVGLDTEADLEWVAAIAGAVAPLCGPLTAEAVVVAGPGAHHLAGPLHLPAVRAGEPVPDGGSFCATIHDTADDRAWLRTALECRRLHVVLGEQDWEGVLVERPVAISWTGDRALPAAVYLAAALDVPLGFGATGGFPVGVARMDPVDVAFAIRRLVRA